MIEPLPHRPPPPPFPRWAVSVVSVLAAAGLGWLLAPWVGDQAPYLLFTVAVMLSARYGGLWSGVTSTVLGGLVAFSLFVSSPGAPAQWLLLGVYLAVGICLSLLAESLRSTTYGVGTAAQRHAERLRLLGEAARRVAGAGPEPKGLAGALAEQAASLVGDTAEVHFVSEDGRALQPVAVHRPDGDTKTVALPAALPAGEMHRYLHGFSSERRLAVPLRVEDRTLGTLALERSSQGPAFNEEDQALAAGLASSASLAILRASDHRQWQSAAAEAKKREESLQEAAEQLRESSRLKDEFLATVAHELRTPLGAMLGWAHILRDEAVDKETASRALDAIVRNAGIQTRLISDLLDISRIVAGTMRVEMQTVELVAVIRAALETVRPTAEAKGVVLSATVDAEAGPVTGDPSRLQQILWNLLSNSIKFTPRGGTVSVRVQSQGDQVEVAVEDSGPGIPAEFLPHVFERFRQAGGAKTRGKGGLGLGLAIVRHLVELHGGSIAVANRENAPGAAFTVRLPIRTLRPGEAPAQTAPLTVPSDAAELPSLEGLRVLVVDDGDESREMVAMVLEKRGAQVTGVPYASEALTTMAEVKPDVLLADLELGDANGDSLIQKIRALPAGEGGSTPAAALGSYARAEDRTRALLAGFQIHLAKPVRPAELVAAVASLSGRTQKATAVEARA
jgi:signal transduction histidine kinase/CheY-like chemotaxis protein